MGYRPPDVGVRHSNQPPGFGSTAGHSAFRQSVLVGLLETFDRKLAFGGEEGRVSPSQEVAMRPPEVFVRELSAQEVRG